MGLRCPGLSFVHAGAEVAFEAVRLGLEGCVLVVIQGCTCTGITYTAHLHVEGEEVSNQLVFRPGRYKKEQEPAGPLCAGCEAEGIVLVQLLTPAPAPHTSTKGAQSMRTSPAGRRAANFTASSPALCSGWGDSDPHLSPQWFPRRLSGSSPGSDRAKSPRERSRGWSLAGWYGLGAAARAAVCSPLLALRGSC